jgi:hypothetical protein
MPILEIKSRFRDKVIYSGEAARIAELVSNAVKDQVNIFGANLEGANLRNASLVGANLRNASLVGANLRNASLVGANLRSASLVGANLRSASLVGANLEGASRIETGETWTEYLEQVIPALLTAGGKALADVVTRKVWDCHSWSNCPMHAAFDAEGMVGVPILLRPRAEQFIRYFDARLIPLEAILKPATEGQGEVSA